MIDIAELHAVTASQLADILALMKELSPESDVTPGMIDSVLKAPGSHLFAAFEAIGVDSAPSHRILGVATLCVYESPTGRKASVEDVVVSAACRGQHIGKKLMEHIITYARTNLADVDLCLTSRPHRVAANNLYKSLGFQPKETNVYKMPIKR